MRNYNAAATVPVRSPKIAIANLHTINENTRLVSTETASKLLLDERGVSLKPETIRDLCRDGKWQQGIFWVKPARHYLINMAALYHAIAFSKLS